MMCSTHFNTGSKTCKEEIKPSTKWSSWTFKTISKCESGRNDPAKLTSQPEPASYILVKNAER